MINTKILSKIDIFHNMYSIPVFEKEKLPYYRDEKDGNLSLIAPFSPLAEHLIINAASVEILELCNGTNNIKDIFNFIINKYESENFQEVKNDLNYSFMTFSSMGIITWKDGVDPFMIKYREIIDNELELVCASEIDLNEIVHFFRNLDIKSDNNNYFFYVNPCKSKGSLTELEVRESLFKK